MPTRKEKLEKYLMPYLHDEELDFEPFMFAMLDREQEIFEDLRQRHEIEGFRRHPHRERTWRIVFEEINAKVTPLQLEQLTNRLRRDINAVADLLLELGKSKPLLAREEGTHD